MRSLRAIEEQGVEVTVIPCSPAGELDPADVERSINANTRAIYITHASNVTETIMPVTEISMIAREKGVIFCVDAAQTAGAIPIGVEDMAIDLLAFTGHKSLFGPQGTGGLYIAGGLEKEITPIIMGGTGSRSEFEKQPDFLPDMYESGTLNAIGIAGLGAGVRFILDEGVDTIRDKEERLTGMLLEGLSAISGVTIYGCRDAKKQTTVVSLGIKDKSPADGALILDEEFYIMSRPGLQCAPAAHRTIGTLPVGTLRLSPGYFSNDNEVRKVIDAITDIAQR